MAIKISAMTPDDSIGGSEKIPVSDGASAKSITTAGLKNYTIDQIEAIPTGSAPSGSDSVFVLQGGVMKPADIDLIAQYAIDIVWGKAVETVPDDLDVFPLKDGNTTEKTVTYAVLKAYLSSAIQTATIDAIEEIEAGSSITVADAVYVLQSGVLKPMAIALVAQYATTVMWDKAAETVPDSADVLVLKDGGVTEKTITLGTLTTFFNTALQATVLNLAGLSAATTPLAAADMFAVTQTTTGKKITFANLTAEVYLALAAHVTGLDEVATTVDSDVFYVLQSGTAKKMTLDQIIAHAGFSITGAGNGVDGMIAQWSGANSLKSLLTMVTSIVSPGSDTDIPTSKAVQDAIDATNADTSTIIYESTLIGAALADADTILVDDGGLGTAQRKSAVSRLWTYITGKIQGLSEIDADAITSSDIIMFQDADDSNNLKTITIDVLWEWLAENRLNTFNLDDLDTPGDNTDLNASNARHGLLLKLTDATGHFLRADGTWATPPGTEYDEIWIPAKDLIASTTAGATAATIEYATNDMSHSVMTFAGADADESAEFDIVMPPAWNLGTLKYKVFWSNGHADSNTDEYVQFYLKLGARSNDDALDATLGESIAVEDQLIVDGDLHVTAASSAVTVGGTAALGDMVHGKLARNYDYAGVGAVMDVDAHVFGVLIQYKKTAVVAAW